MSNSDTGINAILRDIGRTPNVFYRDTALLFKTLDGVVECRENLEREINRQKEQRNDNE